MKRLLLVDDDALILRAYRGRLAAHGFHVNTAADGQAAINLLRSARPDLIVLDLMMPNVSGVDVLKYIRGEPRLAKTPVVVLTNAYLNDLGREAATIGIEGALLKNQCSPSVLMSFIDDLLRNKNAAAEPESAPAKSAAVEPPSSPAPSGPQPSETARPAPAAPAAAPSTPVPVSTPTIPAAHRPADGSSPAAPGGAEPEAVNLGPSVCAELRRLFQAFSRAPTGSEEKKLRLQEFYRKVHFIAATAGLTEYAQVAQVAAVFDALLFVLLENPGRIGPSVLHTIAKLVDVIELMFQQSRDARLGVPKAARVLVVDDDPLSNRLAVTALGQAQLEARSAEDPQLAWQWLQQDHYDVVLLDIEMPGLDGFELCRRLRALPQYKNVPVIYVTVHSDFVTRAKSTLSGGDDLISKPILPIELAAKVIMHLLKKQVAGAK